MRTTRALRALQAVTVMATLVCVRPARADAPTAEALFREGRKLLDEGNVDAACIKLAESQSQEPSSGTLLNLALCHEKQHKVATAWAEYAAAARLSVTQGRPERADVAMRKSAELEPRLPRMIVRAEASIPELKIMRGSDTLGAGVIGTDCRRRVEDRRRSCARTRACDDGDASYSAQDESRAGC